MNTIYQCCYTNRAAKKESNRTSGWGTVAVSPNIDLNAKKGFADIQSRASNITNEMKDENGKELNLLEIEGDGRYFYIVRTQYGLKENTHNRANMFSCGLCISQNEETLNNPGILLSISNRNFTYTVDEAETALTKDVILDKEADFHSIIKKLNISFDAYKELLYSVAEHFTNRLGSPLYVQYDGTDEQLRQLLYIIYYGIPWGFRAVLKTASCMTQNTIGKNIVFSVNASAKKYYYDVFNQQGNIVTNRVMQKLKADRYIDDFIDSIGSPDQTEYYYRLEKMAGVLGGGIPPTSILYKTAAFLAGNPDISKLTAAETLEKISDLRMAGLSGTYTQRYLSELLNRLNTDSIRIPIKELENFVIFTIAGTKEKRLVDHGLEYISKAIYGMDPADRILFLKKLEESNEELFLKVRQMLTADSAGITMLDEFYTNTVLNSNPYSYEVLRKIWKNLKDLWEMNRNRQDLSFKDKLSQYSWEIYVQNLKKKSNPVESLNDYISFVSDVDGKQTAQGEINAAKLSYWDMASISEFKAYDHEIYKTMAVNGCEKSKLFLDCIKIIEYSQGSEEALLKVFGEFVSLYMNSAYFTQLSQLAEIINREWSIVSNSPHNMQDWLKMQVEIPQNQNCSVLDIFINLKTCDYSLLKEHLRKMESTEITDRLFELVRNRLLYNNSKYAMEIPFEVWVRSCTSSTTNRFKVLDSFMEEIPGLDEMDLSEFVFLKDDPFRTEAEQYISSSDYFNKLSRLLNKLLKEIKKMEPKSGFNFGGISGLVFGTGAKKEDYHGESSLDSNPLENEYKKTGEPGSVQSVSKKFRGLFGKK